MSKTRKVTRLKKRVAFLEKEMSKPTLMDTINRRCKVEVILPSGGKYIFNGTIFQKLEIDLPLRGELEPSTTMTFSVIGSISLGATDEG